MKYFIIQKVNIKNNKIKNIGFYANKTIAKVKTKIYNILNDDKMYYKYNTIEKNINLI